MTVCMAHALLNHCTLLAYSAFRRLSDKKKGAQNIEAQRLQNKAWAAQQGHKWPQANSHGKNSGGDLQQNHLLFPEPLAVHQPIAKTPWEKSLQLLLALKVSQDCKKPLTNPNQEIHETTKCRCRKYPWSGCQMTPAVVSCTSIQI